MRERSAHISWVLFSPWGGWDVWAVLMPCLNKWPRFKHQMGNGHVSLLRCDGAITSLLSNEWAQCYMGHWSNIRTQTGDILEPTGSQTNWQPMDPACFLVADTLKESKHRSVENKVLGHSSIILFHWLDSAVIHLASLLQSPMARPMSTVGQTQCRSFYVSSLLHRPWCIREPGVPIPPGILCTSHPWSGKF